MQGRLHGLRSIIVVTIVLIVVALVLLILTAPDPTIVRVRVADAATGKPLEGAVVQIQSQGEQPLPVVATDEDGVARFRNPAPSATYVVRVQKTDYELVIKPRVAVPEAKTTVVDVGLAAHAGGRLYVGLEGTRVEEIDTASLLPVTTSRLPNWKSGAVSRLMLNAKEGLMYAVTSAAGQGAAPRAEGEYDEIDVLYARTKALKRRLEVQSRVQDMEITPDGRYLLALAAPAGAGRLFDQSELIALDAVEGYLLTRTQLVDLDLAAYGSRSAAGGVLTPTLSPAEPGAEIVVKADNSGLYVLHANEAAVWMLDPDARQVIARIAIQARPGGGALSPDGRSLYVWATDPGYAPDFPPPMVSMMVPGTECPPQHVATTTPFTFTTPAGESAVITRTQAATYTLLGPDIGAYLYGDDRVYRSCTYYRPSAPATRPAPADALLTIDTGTNAVASGRPLPPGTTALAVSPTRPELYVLNGELGLLTVYYLDGSAPPVAVAVGRDAGAVTVSADGNWAYVANRDSRSVSAIYLPAAVLIQTIPVDGLPLSLALN